MPLTTACILEEKAQGAGGGAAGPDNGEGLQRGPQGFGKGQGGGGFERKELPPREAKGLIKLGGECPLLQEAPLDQSLGVGEHCPSTADLGMDRELRYAGTLAESPGGLLGGGTSELSLKDGGGTSHT